MTIKIIFTKIAKPVSDFDAESEVKAMLALLDCGEIKELKVCNMLVHTMLRAAYHTTHKHLQEHTTWWYEDELINMTDKMGLEDINFWSHSVTCLEEKALEDLFSL